MIVLTASLVALHLALPFVLRRLGSRGVRDWSVGRMLLALLRRRPTGLYEWCTIGLAAAVAATALFAPWYREPGTPWYTTGLAAGWLAAVVVGVAVPLGAAWIGGNPRRMFTGSMDVWSHGRLVLCAEAEELLWRSAGWAVLRAVGMPGWACGVLTVLGFGLLHVPLYGLRRLPYQLVLGSALTVLAVTCGLLPAVLAHLLHNEVLATSTSSAGRPLRRARPPTVLPPSQAWDGGRGSAAQDGYR